MKATDRDGYLWVETSTGEQRPCTRICGAVAWGDDSSTDETARNHALVVGGEHRDGTFRIFEAFSGPWLNLIPAMIDAKNSAWCLTWWVDPSAEGRYRELYRIDGLTVYRNGHPPDDLSYDHTARISAWWKSFTDDLEGARTMIDKLRVEKIARVDQRHPAFRKAFESSKVEQIRTPVPLATIALIWHLWSTSEQRRGKPQEMPTQWHWGG